MLYRIAIPAVLAILVCYNEMFFSAVYKYIGSDEFRIVGSLNKFETPCNDLPGDLPKSCDKAYVIDSISIVKGMPRVGEMISYGIGVLSGSSEWFCYKNGQILKVNETGVVNGASSFREGVHIYQVGNVVTASCEQNLYIRVKRDSSSSINKVGWKSGYLVVGSPTIVSAFKSVNDFFSSYFRAFLAVITLIFALIFETVFTKNTLGTFWYRRAMLFFAVHFFASSSILDFLFPNSLGLGFPLLMAGGTGGCFLLIVAAFEVNLKRKLLSNTATKSFPILLLFSFVLLLFSYRTFGGGLYTSVQWFLAVTLLVVSFLSRSPVLFVFSILFNSDVMAAKGFLPGFPSNVSTHFLFFCFIYDSFEWITKNSSLMNSLNKVSTSGDMSSLLGQFSKRFGLSRVSVSLFTADHKFTTYLLADADVLIKIDERETVTQIAASVMTSRSPVVRVKIGSSLSKALKGANSLEDWRRGREFSVFPLIHSQKVLGVINITGYPSYSLGDPSQMDLFLSLAEKLLPKIAENYYKQDLSPLLDEQKVILEIESKFATPKIKDKVSITRNMDALAQAMNCKIIISQAFPENDKISTYSCHHYAEQDSAQLSLHSLQLSETLITSPANLAYSRREPVYIGDVERMLSLYSEFVISLLRRNKTKCLLVSPLIIENSRLPWGVVWLEFPNPMNRSDEDLRDLAALVCESIQRQLLLHFEYEKQSKLNSELSRFIPERVLKKIQLGVNPREEEHGYLLNVDLAGSTKLAKAIGDSAYGNFISEVSLQLSTLLKKFDFIEQMIIWDAFIFTRDGTLSKLTESEMQEITAKIGVAIENAKRLLSYQNHLGFRAVLHFGDTTRDFKAGEVKTWGIVGAALAESCKMESGIKDKSNILFVSEECRSSKNTFFPKAA